MIVIIFDSVFSSSLKEKISHQEYPPLIKEILLFLPALIENSRLAALATHFENNFETCSADQIADMFTSYQDSDNNLNITTLLIHLHAASKECCSNAKAEHTLIFLNLNLKKKKRIKTDIPASFCNNVFPSFTDIVLDRLLEFELSSTNKLVEASLNAFKNFSLNDNIENLIMRILRINWNIEPDVERMFMLLS